MKGQFLYLVGFLGPERPFQVMVAAMQEREAIEKAIDAIEGAGIENLDTSHPTPLCLVVRPDLIGSVE